MGFSRAQKPSSVFGGTPMSWFRSMASMVKPLSHITRAKMGQQHFQSQVCMVGDRSFINILSKKKSPNDTCSFPNSIPVFEDKSSHFPVPMAYHPRLDLFRSPRCRKRRKRRPPTTLGRPGKRQFSGKPSSREIDLSRSWEPQFSKRFEDLASECLHDFDWCFTIF